MASDFIYTGCSADELKPLIMSHHYSMRMPSNIQHCYGVREPGGLFGDTGPLVAGVMFSIPPTRWAEDVLELSRLVRADKEGLPQLSGLISFATKWLRRNGADLLVSFADETQKHHGGIYRACSWNYAGFRPPRMDGLLINGSFVPGRSCNSLFGTRSPEKVQKLKPSHIIKPHWDAGKHIYWKALGPAGKRKADRLNLECVEFRHIPECERCRKQVTT